MDQAKKAWTALILGLTNKVALVVQEYWVMWGLDPEVGLGARWYLPNPLRGEKEDREDCVVQSALLLCVTSAPLGSSKPVTTLRTPLLS